MTSLISIEKIIEAAIVHAQQTAETYARLDAQYPGKYKDPEEQALAKMEAYQKALLIIKEAQQ